MSQAPVTVVSPKPAPPRRKRRWLLRALAVLIVLLLVVALVVQIVLWTDLPRGIVVRQIEQQLGLRLQVKSLSTGWLGHTQLNDVQISLPLADKAFLQVPVMKVKNTSLFGLLIGRSVEVQAIELDQPHLYVLQDAAGQWNLAEVAELLARTGGKKTGQESAKTSAPKVPNVHLAGGIVSVIDNKNRTAEIQPLNVDGYADTAVSWKYDVQIPPRVSVTGRLVPGGNWAHQVAIKIQDIDVWAKPWISDFPKVAVDVDWAGELSEAGVGGRLNINKATVGLKTGQAEAYGALTATAGAGAVTIKPTNLLLKTGQKVLPDVSLASGAISYTAASSDVKVEQLLVDLFGGPARVSASYNVNTRAGRVDARWQDLSLPDSKITHSGSFAASLRQPFPNQIVLDGDLKSTGQTPSGPWTVTANFGADGSSFQDLQWSVHTGKASYDRRGAGINLDGISMNGSVRNETLTLASISLPKASLLAGSGDYHFTGAQEWQVDLRGEHWPFHPIEGTELAFALKAAGNVTQAQLYNFVLKTPDAQFSAKAKYTYGQPSPLEGDVTITNAPPAQAPAAFSSSEEAKVVNGTIDGRASLHGTLQPLKLNVAGHLRGREIDVRGHHIGDLDLLLSDKSHIDVDGVFIFSQKLSLLGGQFGFDGIYLFDANGLKVDMSMKDVSLAEVATVADQTGISGTMDGTISVFVPGLNPNPAHLQVPPALFTFHNVNARGIKVDQVDATLSLAEGHLAVDPIHLRYGDGFGEVKVAANVQDFRRINAAARFTDWPIDIPGALVHVSGSVLVPAVQIQLPNPKALDPQGRSLRVAARQIDVHGATTLKGETLGDLVAHAGIDGREIDVRGVHMKLLGGRLDGQAHGNLDEPLKTTAEVAWENVDLQKLALIFPQLKDMKGELTGDLRFAPSTTLRPREPLAIVLTTQFENGAWRTLPIQDARIAAYVGPNEEAPQAGWRVVLEDNKVDPSFIHFAGGTAQLWGRFGTHGRGNSTQGQISFSDLDLDALVHAIEPTAKPMPGSVAGSLMFLRAPAPPKPNPLHNVSKMFPAPPVIPVPPATAPSPDEPPLKALIQPIYAEGEIQLTHTNLANFGPFAFLYNAANLFQNDRTADGSGNMQFNLQKGTLTVDHLRYFNRGTEIRAVAAVEKIWEVPDGPVSLTAFLTARPLRNLNLPVLADFDTVLTAIQSSLKLTGARVEGTLHKYRIIGPLGVTDMTDEMRRFLVGDVKGELKGGAGG